GFPNMFARRLKYVPYAFYLLVLCAPFSAAADSEGMSLSASPCTGMDLTFSPVSFHFSALAGTQLLTVSSPATCQYYVRPLSGNFINPDGTVHTGPSTVDINVSANMSGTSRSGQIQLFAISGGPPVWVITVTQDGAS